MAKDYLFIIDPQVDFIGGGSLEVKGGTKALDKILGILDEPWEKIYVTLDSHNPSNLGFKTNYVDGYFIKSGEPIPQDAKLIDPILREATGYYKVTAWPPHCVIGTKGWQIYEPLQKKLLSLGDKVQYLMKGQDDTKDSYSVFTDKSVMDLKGFDMLYPENVIYYTGLAEDFCVLETIKGMQKFEKMVPSRAMSELKPWKHILLENMTAGIMSRDKIDELYKGLNIERK